MAVETLKSVTRALTPAALAAMKSIGIGASQRLQGILLNGTFNPATRETDYGSNWAFPNLIPPLESLLSLNYGGYIGDAELKGLVAWHGAALDPSFLVRESRVKAWQKLWQMNRPHYSLDFLRKLKRQGVQGSERRLRDALQQEGFPVPPIQDLYVNEWESLETGTLLQLYFQGVIDTDKFIELAAIIGYRKEEAQQIIDAADDYPGVGDTLRLFNYGVLDGDSLNRYLRANSIDDGFVRENVKLLRFAGPTAASVLGTAGKQAWDERLAAAWTLDGEKPDQYAEWAKRAGLDYSAGVGRYGENDPAAKTWADLAWREHWALPNVPMLWEIIRRFRGTQADRSTWRYPDTPPLTTDTIQRTLSAAGIPPALRPYLGRLTYIPISIRHLRMIVAQLNPPITYVQGVYQDNGYSPDDALTVAKALIADVHAKDNAELLSINKRAWGKFIGAIETSYELGTLSGQQATAQLQANGLPAATVAIMLATVDAGVGHGIVRKVMARAKADLFAGRTNMAGALSRLIKAGVDGQRAAQITAGWQAEFGEGRQHVATNKILSLLRKGFITRDQAVIRLDNIGWAKADELLLLAEVQGEMAKDMASAIAHREASKHKEERGAEQALHKTAAMANSLQRRLKTLTPPKDIVKWYVDGVWSEGKARDRLRLLGYPDDAIDAMFVEALDKHKASKKTK